MQDMPVLRAAAMQDLHVSACSHIPDQQQCSRSGRHAGLELAYSCPHEEVAASRGVRFLD